ncbi:unnamed protein product [Bursaphelenchus okinawaensis]|uniref:Uncharacterized protein n=1 Tax=Bursaphelenchus okinawaensis TaxID=465554 RepID=A0A811KXT9_9BILA|nr:unnamed protein product [Bursaphelenchus okinawaensis]CAG9114003.1 unnamed protein product [Bursaphelenchus okinawaensis]
MAAHLGQNIKVIDVKANPLRDNSSGSWTCHVQVNELMYILKYVIQRLTEVADGRNAVALGTPYSNSTNDLKA